VEFSHVYLNRVALSPSEMDSMDENVVPIEILYH